MQIVKKGNLAGSTVEAPKRGRPIGSKTVNVAPLSADPAGPLPYSKEQAMTVLGMRERQFIGLYRSGKLRFIGQGRTTGRIPPHSRWPKAVVDRIAMEGC